MGVAAHAATAGVQHGGVAFIARSPQPMVASGDEFCMSEPYTSGRWQEVFVPIVGAQATDGLFVAGVYAKHGTDTEALFEHTFDTAARVGQSPYIVCGDFNCGLGGSRALSAALDTGEWFSAAVCAGDDRPTYSASSAWNG
eukprot:3031812-Alexandrium_andersonii.AAC.1